MTAEGLKGTYVGFDLDPDCPEMGFIVYGNPGRRQTADQVPVRWAPTTHAQHDAMRVIMSSALDGAPLTPHNADQVLMDAARQIGVEVRVGLASIAGYTSAA